MNLLSVLSLRRFKRRQRSPHQSGGPDYRTPDGRRHLRGVPYLLPKDAPENQRLDFQHWYLKRLVGRSYLAPLPKTMTTILDVGCGSGLWAREMAQAFAYARVVGVDLELPSPMSAPAPAGSRLSPLPVEFVQANILEGLPFPDHSFDFVHQRLLVEGIPPEKWQAAVNELVRVAKTGGYVEVFECSTQFYRPGPATEVLLGWQAKINRQRGWSQVDIAPNLQTFLRVAGLAQIRGRVWQAPLGTWGRHHREQHDGHLLATDVLAVLRSMQGWTCERLSITPTAFAAVVDALPAEWVTYKTEFRWYGAYGLVV